MKGEEKRIRVAFMEEMAFHEILKVVLNLWRQRRNNIYDDVIGTCGDLGFVL